MDLRPSQKIAKAFGVPCHQRCCRADITVCYFSSREAPGVIHCATNVDQLLSLTARFRLHRSIGQQSRE